MKYICPLITVNDIDSSKEFYQKILKQKIKYDFGENVTFEGDFALHLKSHYQELIDSRKIVTQSNSFELYFEYDNIDELVCELKENNIEFIHEAREQPWRQKVIRFYDLDKNIIEVGESLQYLSFRLSKEGKDIAEISKITNMPKEFVIAAIKEKSIS